MTEVGLLLALLDAAVDQEVTIVAPADGSLAANDAAANVDYLRREREDWLAEIRETLEQTWPRCGGHTPSAAEDWLAEGFLDEDVQAFLEVGVFTVGAAMDLQAVGLEPRDVRSEHADVVTLGLAFARAELTIAEVQRAVLGGEVETP